LGEAIVAETEEKSLGPPGDNDWRRQYWRKNLRLMVVLLAVWFIASFGCGILFVEQLNQITIIGFPLGFWFAQQGSIYVFLLLILVYCLYMDRLDKEFGVDERNDEPSDGGTGSSGDTRSAESAARGGGAS
jgi:putative solute:sodium symporter small subunit